MNLSDYEAVWKRQELPQGEAADLIDLKQTFETKRRKMEHTILLRNSFEGVGGIAASLGFGLLTWRLGLIDWPIVLGLLLIAGVSCVFLHDWWRFRRARLGPEASLLAKLKANIVELRHQRRLVAHMGKWYLTTYTVAILLLGYGLSQQVGRGAPSGFLITLLTTPSTATYIVILLVIPIAATVWWWRDVQKGIRLRIDPRLAELEKLHRELVSSGN